MCNYCLLVRSSIALAVLALVGCMSQTPIERDGNANLISITDPPVDRGWGWLESRPGSEGPRR